MDGFKTISIEQIDTSPTNPRKFFDPERLQELTESVKLHGILQPLLVRPLVGLGRAPYELVCGHRRFSAAAAAGLGEVPAVVREMTDTQALEVQVIENLQRDDLHPLEEAEGYARLITHHGYTVDALATKVGKSRGYVYGRLQIARLPEAAKRVFLEGEMNLSLALLVARLDNHEIATEAAEKIIRGHRYFDNGEKWLPLTVQQAREMIERDYMLDMSQAPFQIFDPELVPEAGPCTTCPKRTGTAADLFGEFGKRDLCTDRACFAAKVAAAWQLAANEFGRKLKGRKFVVLSVEQSEKVWDRYSGGTTPTEKWATPKTEVSVGKKSVPVKDLFAERAWELPVAHIARSGKNGKPVELFKRADVEAILAAASGAKSGAEKKAQAEKQAAAPAYDYQFESAVRRAAFVDISPVVAEKGAALSERDFLALVCECCGDHLIDEVLERRGKAKDKTYLPKLSIEELRGFTLEVIYNNEEHQVLRALKLRTEPYEKAARKRLLAEAAAPAPTATPKAAKKTAKNGGAK
jgi:ParB/RepB/Spo0J family partition protein